MKLTDRITKKRKIRKNLFGILTDVSPLSAEKHSIMLKVIFSTFHCYTTELLSFQTSVVTSVDVLNADGNAGTAL